MTATATVPQDSPPAPGPTPQAFRANRTDRSILAGVFALYAIGFVIWWPSAVAVTDEAEYVRQASAYAVGETHRVVRDPWTGGERTMVAGSYPLGTAALQAPFVRIGGWRAAALASVFGLGVLLWAVARLLEDAGRSPLYALIALGYPPALVLGRIAMSDVPGAALVAVGLWAFWRGQFGVRGVPVAHPGRWLFGAGLALGSSVLLRETIVLVFAPFAIGAVVRYGRQWHAARVRPRTPILALVAGFSLAATARLVAWGLVFGHVFYVRYTPVFDVSGLWQQGPLYLFALLVLVPGGLLAVLLYKGPLRVEMTVATLGSLLFFAMYEYSGAQSGMVRQLVLGPRYFLPLLPLLILAIADLGARIAPRLPASLPLRPLRWGWIAAMAAVALGVHPVVEAQNRSNGQLTAALHSHTREGSAVITNVSATAKQFDGIYGNRTLVGAPFAVSRIGILLQKNDGVQIAVIERTNSAFFQELTASMRLWVAAAAKGCRLSPQVDVQVTPAERVLVWEVLDCDAPPTAGAAVGAGVPVP